jgi:hypothetical protein
MHFGAANRRPATELRVVTIALQIARVVEMRGFIRVALA